MEVVFIAVDLNSALVSNRSVSGDVYEVLKSDIINLVLKPGQYISENEIAKLFNISRTPVKSAFLRLMSEGFIEIKPQRGTYVTLLDLEMIKQIIYLRTVVETDVFFTAIDLMNDDMLEMINKNLTEQKNLMDTADFAPSSFYKLDSEFHSMIYDYIGRQKLWEMIQGLQVFYTRFRMLDIVATSSFGTIYQEHLEMYKHIDSKDKAALKNDLNNHLSGNLKRLNHRIKDEFSEYFTTESTNNSNLQNHITRRNI